jgi:hypothetical protein
VLDDVVWVVEVVEVEEVVDPWLEVEVLDEVLVWVVEVVVTDWS